MVRVSLNGAQTSHYFWHFNQAEAHLYSTHLASSSINILTKNQDKAIIISKPKVTDPVISVADLVGDLDVFLNHLAVIRIYIDQPEKVFYAMLRRRTLCEM
ncbi:MAG TPA: hypothetical protein DCG72_14130 [Gammaproteobacteria bacterium]|nr:hypothetical protein [Gammaproteobacteria bacterium]